MVTPSSASEPGIVKPAEIAELFTELGAQLVECGDNAAVLSLLAEAAVARVPGADHAGMTVGRSPGTFTTEAATDDLVRRVDDIQYRLRSGPCVDAIVDNAIFNAADLRTDPRWPDFGRQAVEAAGVLSMLSVRMYVEADAQLIGALNLYSHRPDAFDPGSETITILLATHGALALAHAMAATRAANLARALETSREIGIAMGIIMAVTRVTADDAFGLLRIASQHSHRKLRDIARDVAETGVLPELPTWH